MLGVMLDASMLRFVRPGLAAKLHTIYHVSMPDEPYTPAVGDLAPSARMLRTITVAQMRRGDTPGANTLAVLGLELLRLLGDLDDNYEPHTQKEHP